MSREIQKLLIDANPALGGHGSLKRKRTRPAGDSATLEAKHDLQTSLGSSASSAGRRTRLDSKRSKEHVTIEGEQPQGATEGALLADEARLDWLGGKGHDRGEERAGRKRGPHWFMPEASMSPASDRVQHALSDADGISTPPSRRNWSGKSRPRGHQSVLGEPSQGTSHSETAAQQPSQAANKKMSREMRKLAIDANPSLGGIPGSLRTSRTSKPVGAAYVRRGHLRTHDDNSGMKSRHPPATPIQRFPSDPPDELVDAILMAFAEAAHEWGLVRALQGDAQESLRRERFQEADAQKAARVKSEVRIAAHWPELDVAASDGGDVLVSSLSPDRLDTSYPCDPGLHDTPLESSSQSDVCDTSEAGKSDVMRQSEQVETSGSLQNHSVSEVSPPRDSKDSAGSQNSPRSRKWKGKGKEAAVYDFPVQRRSGIRVAT